MIQSDVDRVMMIQWWWCPNIVSNCGDECVKRIPSLLRESVVQNVTSEDILHCIIIIVFYCIFIVTLFEDVFPPIRDFIIVIGHVNSWGKTSIVNRGNSPEENNVKCIFGHPRGKIDLFRSRSHPYWNKRS